MAPECLRRTQLSEVGWQSIVLYGAVEHWMSGTLVSLGDMMMI